MLVLLALGSPACPLQAEKPGESAPSGDEREARPTPTSIVVQWWERPDIVEAIELRPEQIEALNVLWIEALEARNAGRTEQKRLFADFTAALRSDTPDGRDVLIDRLAESAAAQARLPAELMDRGVAILDPDQHRRVAEHFPWIFRRSWMGHSTARERQLEKRGGSFRIQPKRIDTQGKEHE